ncbi:hypothetical protein Cni_G21478 [Canna indica]|uniref:Dirigent protein n=1 Tax=Canna indica TaxID=4628 RepID=A0AAQ3QHB1_9LILI|nr:hypothetical protein Cni_G21478 [Canna indica]
MAKLNFHTSSSSLLQLFLLLTISLAAAQGPPTPPQQKLSHLRFFWHDVVGGPNATAVPVTRPPNATATGFGTMVVIDDAMTEGPEITSKPVGRAQGFYLLASQTEAALLMSMNLAFTDGKRNGSTLAVLGRNPVFDEARELAVVGGTGVFRLARGYAQLKTYSFDATGNAVVEYNVYVTHY